MTTLVSVLVPPISVGAFLDVVDWVPVEAWGAAFCGAAGAAGAGLGGSALG